MQPKYTGSNAHLAIVPLPDPDCERYVGPVQVAVRRAGRRYRLSPCDMDDLQSEVWVKLLARRGRILRKLRAVSHVETYLARVAANLVLDRQNAERGKWRPSAAVRRAGTDAVLIDRLMTRDGMSSDAVDEWLRCARPAARPASDLAALIARADRRPRRFIGIDGLSELASTERSPFDASCRSESARDRARVKGALARALQRLPARDRELLIERYARRTTVAEIAARAGVEAKPLYRYFGTLLRNIRQELAEAGVDRAVALRLLADDGADWDCGLDSEIVPRTMRPRRFA